MWSFRFVYYEPEISLCSFSRFSNLIANIGFDANGTLKIFDFDLARVLPLGRDRLFQLTRNVGSPRYMAPEVKLGDKYNLTADVFSFGVVVYEIFTLKNFGSPQQCDWGKKNKRIPPSFSANLRSILEQCLARSNTDRPHMDRVRRILKAEIDEDSADLRYGMMELTNLNLDSSSLLNWENTTPRRMLPSVPSAKFKTCASDDISRSQRTTETEAETAVLTDRLPHHTDKANGCDNTNPVLWVWSYIAIEMFGNN